MNPAFKEYAERFPKLDPICGVTIPELEVSFRWLTTHWLAKSMEAKSVSKTVEWSGRGIHYLGGEILEA